jgi:hypothetical protein
LQRGHFLDIAATDFLELQGGIEQEIDLPGVEILDGKESRADRRAKWLSWWGQVRPA